MAVLEMNHFERQTISFVVRLWVEPMQPGETLWRGQVERVGSGETAHFQTSEALLEFIARCVHPPEGPPPKAPPS